MIKLAIAIFILSALIVMFLWNIPANAEEQLLIVKRDDPNPRETMFHIKREIKDKHQKIDHIILYPPDVDFGTINEYFPHVDIMMAHAPEDNLSIKIVLKKPLIAKAPKKEKEPEKKEEKKRVEPVQTRSWTDKIDTGTKENKPHDLKFDSIPMPKDAGVTSFTIDAPHPINRNYKETVKRHKKKKKKVGTRKNKVTKSKRAKAAKQDTNKT